MISHFVSESFLVNAAFVCFLLFALVGAFDGIYFHLIKFKLHLHPESRTEHLIHTLRAFLLAPIAYFLFSKNAAGYTLLIGVGFVLLDFSIEVIDILVEKNSRANIGGISPTEYIAHVAATSFRTAAIALLLASKPLSAFTSNFVQASDYVYPYYLSYFASAFAMMSAAGGLMSLSVMEKKPMTNSSYTLSVKSSLKNDDKHLVKGYYVSLVLLLSVILR